MCVTVCSQSHVSSFAHILELPVLIALREAWTILFGSALAHMLENGKLILRVSCADNKDSDLSPAPGSPDRWSCGVASPALGCRRSFSERFCCHHWPFHTPGFSRLHRHYGGLPSSDDPTSPPGAGCRLVSLSERAKDTPSALEREISVLVAKQFLHVK